MSSKALLQFIHPVTLQCVLEVTGDGKVYVEGDLVAHSKKLGEAFEYYCKVKHNMVDNPNDMEH